MSIRIKCPHCGKGIKAPSKLAGTASTCPGCGEQIEIPGVPIPVVCTRSSWVDRTILLAILLVLLVGLSPQIPWINKTPLSTAPMPVVIENRRPIDVEIARVRYNAGTLDVEVQNSTLDVEVQNSTLGVDVQNSTLGVDVQNVFPIDVEVQNSTLDVNVINEPLAVNVQ